MDRSGNAVCVFSRNSVFSDLAVDCFLIDGKSYTTVDLFVQFKFLRSFGLLSVAHRLQKIRDPAEFRRQLEITIAQMKVEKILTRIMIQKWTSLNAKTLLKRAYKAKLEQSIAFRRQLQKTSESILIFASKNSRVVGVGMTEIEFRAWMVNNKVSSQCLLDELALGYNFFTTVSGEMVNTTALGANLVGLVLMELRAEMRSLRFMLPSLKSIHHHSTNAHVNITDSLKGGSNVAHENDSSLTDLEVEEVLYRLLAEVCDSLDQHRTQVSHSIKSSQNAIMPLILSLDSLLSDENTSLIGTLGHTELLLENTWSGCVPSCSEALTVQCRDAAPLANAQINVDKPYASRWSQATESHSRSETFSSIPSSSAQTFATNWQWQPIDNTPPVPCDASGFPLLPYVLPVPIHMQGELMTHYQTEIKNITGHITETDCNFLNGEIVCLNGNIVQVITELPPLPPPHTVKIGVPDVVPLPPMWAVVPQRTSRSKKARLRKREKEKRKAMFPTLSAEIEYYRKRWIRGARLTITGEFQECSDVSDFDSDDEVLDASDENGESVSRNYGLVPDPKARQKRKLNDFASHAQTMKSLAEFYSDDLICVYSNVKKNKHCAPSVKIVNENSNSGSVIKEEPLDIDEWFAEYAREKENNKRSLCATFKTEILFEDSSDYRSWLTYLEEDEDYDDSYNCEESTRSWYKFYKESVLLPLRWHEQDLYVQALEEEAGKRAIKEEPLDGDYIPVVKLDCSDTSHVKEEIFDDGYAAAYTGYRNVIPENALSETTSLTNNVCELSKVKPELVEPSTESYAFVDEADVKPLPGLDNQGPLAFDEDCYIVDCGVTKDGGMSFTGKPVKYDRLMQAVRHKR